MDLTASTRSPTAAGQVWRITWIALATVVGSILCGRLFTVAPIQNWHESSFESIVEGLRDVPLLLDVSGTLTDAGHTTINFLMLAVLAGAAVVLKRARSLSWVVVLGLVALVLRPFQSLVTVASDGTTPVSELIEGTAGPYFSGGVFRVVVIFGAAAALFGLQRRGIVAVALVAGSIEGITRMVLGRHWPLDILAALPIGLGVVALVVLAEELLADFFESLRSESV